MESFQLEQFSSCNIHLLTRSSIRFLDKPAVILRTNATTNKTCGTMWVNFTCNSSRANPPVQRYLLYEYHGVELKETNISTLGNWMRDVSQKGHWTFYCKVIQILEDTALAQRLGSGTSVNNVTLSVYGRYWKRYRKCQLGHHENFSCIRSFFENFTKGMSVLAYLMAYSTANLQDFECKKFIYIRPKYFSGIYLALYKLIKTTTKSGTYLAITSPT